MRQPLIEGCVDSYASARRGVVESGICCRKEGVSMGLPSLLEYELWRTDDEFRACAGIVHARGKGEGA